MLPLRFLSTPRSSVRAACMVGAVSAAAACPLAARALQPVAEQAQVLEVQSEWVPQPTNAPEARSLAPGQAVAATLAQRHTLWARRGAAAVGLGVQSAAPSGPAGLAPAAGTADRASLAGSHLVVGMALETSARSRLVVDTPLLPAPRLDDSLHPAANGREVRVGLQIKPADPLKSLRAGQLFKLELSTRSQLALKPRSGGVMMSYSAKF